MPKVFRGFVYICYVSFTTLMFADVVQLQTFTNMALISHCEDATTADSVKNLEALGTKMAPFIYHLRPTAGVNEFIDCCNSVRMDSLKDVPDLLVRIA